MGILKNFPEIRIPRMALPLSEKKSGENRLKLTQNIFFL